MLRKIFPDSKRRPAPGGRLLSRPRPTNGAGPKGLHPLGLGRGRDGLIYVPEGCGTERPSPLALVLHGASGDARQMLSLLSDQAERHGIILLSPDSRAATWDVIDGGYGPDVSFIDGALAQTFARHAVDPARVAVGGFSDGASYALSLGLTNGDLFTHVVAFSPGGLSPSGREGSPRIFVSHGTRDGVLPISWCGRRIVAQARGAGYDVRYVEFEGGHAVPPEVAGEAVAWFLS